MSDYDKVSDDYDCACVAAMMAEGEEKAQWEREAYRLALLMDKMDDDR